MAEASDRRQEGEFADYLRDHQSRLYAYIHSLVRDLNDADDLLQQTTLILWKKFGGVRPTGELLRLGLRDRPAGGRELPSQSRTPPALF